MKKFMILGAGIYQVPLIRKAKEMGLYTVVVSIPGDYPGFALADRIYPLDTRDREGILQAAREENISGICTAGTDVAVAAVGYVCDQLGLSGISAGAAETVTDKWKMKEAFQRGSVSTAAFRRVFSLEDAKDAASRFGYPVCLKAVDKSGSRGIQKVSSPEEMERAWQVSRSVTDRDYLLVEEFIDAHEIGVDGFIKDGRPVLLVPHDKFVYRAGNVTIPGGHRFPYDASPTLLEELSRQITNAVRAVKMDNCPFNADVFVRDGKVWLIEIGGRSGATCIPELMSIYCGFSYYEKMIRAALGEPVDFPIRDKRPCMAKLLFSEREGILKAIDSKVLESLNTDKISWHLDLSPGDRIPKVHNGTDRIGHLIMEGSDENLLDRKLETLRNALVIEKS